MNRFYVGQRVRIVDCLNPQMVHMVGRHGRITSAGKMTRKGNPSWYVDGADINIEGRGCSWSEHHLEPLTDPGREVISWEACEWKPEHLRLRFEASAYAKTPLQQAANVRAIQQAFAARRIP